MDEVGDGGPNVLSSTDAKRVDAVAVGNAAAVVDWFQFDGAVAVLAHVAYNGTSGAWGTSGCLGRSAAGPVRLPRGQRRGSGMPSARGNDSGVAGAG